MKMPHLQVLNFKTKEEWRDWLQKHHSTVNEAWVIIYKKHSEKDGLKYLEAVEEAVCYGWIDSKMNRVDEDTFRQRFSPRRKNSIWSKINKELATRLINEGKMTKAGYEAITEGKRSGKWQDAYTSKTIPAIPDDLQQALHASPTAHEHFQAFPNSTKLMYIHWILNAKRPGTRAKRIRQVVERAEKNIKPS
jgi:uncharacterized protein YdeI (YjbR/CyaY-like superfamily)